MALSTKQAAEKLGISQVRVRELLQSGALEGERVGRSWTVSEASVQSRAAKRPKAGRPKSNASPSPVHHDAQSPLSIEYDSSHAHDRYIEFRRALPQLCTVDALSKVSDSTEQRFYLNAYNYFLQEKQRELIAAGVY